MAIDISTFSKYKYEKLLRCQQHPQKNLFIWNYTDMTQCKQLWDEVTIHARGLVTDDQGNIVARSFKKFHNIEENRHVATKDFVIYEKLDGSLIIVFWYDNEWIVASRGSFESFQSQVARELLQDKFDCLKKELAYSFEVIYPENRIVVDYHDRRDIVFLAAFDVNGNEHIEECVELSRHGITCPVTYNFDDYKKIKQLDWTNSEGFVVRFSNGDRVKIKFQNYLTMHRIVTNINAKEVWNMFCKNHDSIDDTVLAMIPDEFMKWVHDKWSSFHHMFHSIKTEYLCLHQVCKNSTYSRAEYAKLASKQKHPKLLFALFDGKVKAFDELICDMIRPINGHLDVPFTGKGASPKKENTPRTITILVGPSGSGKTTWCKDFLRNNPNTVRVNRDDIRTQLYGEDSKTYYSRDAETIWKREQFVSAIEVAHIRTALTSNYDVVIDNTNLKKRYIDSYIKTFPYEQFQFEIVNVSLEQCIENNSKRPVNTRTSTDKIEKQYIDYETIKADLVNRVKHSCYEVKPICMDTQLPYGYIFDVDGTLADNTKRSPYDWENVDKDTVIEEVKQTLIHLHSIGNKIAICTGRDGISEGKTKEWLAKHSIPYDYFYIRDKGNCEEDWKIKERMWRDISTKMRIIAIFDDRDCVVRHARLCGLKVYQVAEGDF